MKIVLDVDDACIPHVDGERSADAVLMYVKTDPLFFMRAAHTLTVRGYFGEATEERV